MSQITAPEIQQRYSLLTYLELIYLPSFRRTGSRSQNIIGRTIQWPQYRDLQRLPGTRSLREVINKNTWKFSLSAKNYLSSLSDVYIINENLSSEEESPRLRLPNKELVSYDDEDLEFLSNIKNEDDFVTLMQEYVLVTVSEAIRLIERVSLDAPLTRKLKFQNSSHLCTAHHARWDVLTLPADAFSGIPLSIIFVPPWAFGIHDFRDLTNPQRFTHAALDTLNTKEHTASDKLWAVVHDVCKSRGHKFVITNYLRWTFGEFNNDYTLARTTEPIEARILSHDGIGTEVPWVGCNVVEFLVFWVQAARGRAIDDYEGAS